MQALPRLTGRIHSRPSASVGQIAPDEEHLALCAANCFVRVSQVQGAQQRALGLLDELHEAHDARGALERVLGRAAHDLGAPVRRKRTSARVED